jgi:hypothetical protein
MWHGPNNLARISHQLSTAAAERIVGGEQSLSLDDAKADFEGEEQTAAANFLQAIRAEVCWS